MMAGKDKITVNKPQHMREIVSAFPANARFWLLSISVCTMPMMERTIISRLGKAAASPE